MQLTLAAAFVAGLISFLSPCVLPVVPAYLGQLGAIAVGPPGGGLEPLPVGGPVAPSLARRRAMVLPSALGFVLGFTAVFTLLGLTAYVGRGLGIDLPVLRPLGGLVLIVLGLNLAGVLRLEVLARSWRPLDRLVARRSRAAGAPVGRSPLGAFGLGAIFALGWTPCVGPTLGAILGLAALGPSGQVVILFVAYSLGLAVPFVAVALALDRAPAILRPMRRHARAVELVGGGLVALIGLALVFDWLGFLARTFSFLSPSV